MKKYLLLGFVSLFLLFALFFYQNTRLNDGKLHLIVCNVGQGDGILIRTPNGSDILVDGGPDASILNCLSNHLPFWDRTIELIIVTHSDADHSAGIINVLQSYNLMSFATQSTYRKTEVYKRLLKLLASKKTEVRYLSKGDKLSLTDGTIFNILSPESKIVHSIDKTDSNFKSFPVNDFAVVSRLELGNFSALLTADAPADTEDKIALDIGKIDILKVPHHGSKTGMSDYFLSNINPSLAIISVGKHNFYGHPTKIAMDLLKKYNIKFLRTDLNGEVEVITDGKTYSVVSN